MLAPFRMVCLLLIALVLLIAFVPAEAQDIDLSETYSFEDGTAFSYPSDWHLDKKPTYLKIASDETEIFIVTPDTLAEMGYDNIGSPGNLLAAYFRDFFGDTLDFHTGDLQIFEVGGRPAARYDYVDANDSQALLIAVQFSDESFGIIDSVSKVGDFTEEDAVLAVAGSFNRGAGESGSAVSAEPCFVSTDTRDTVSVRVGPGTNRTPYAFLPPNEDFEVLGQAEADDGSLWWKLDKEAVAPGKAAAEAWVAQEDVEAVGGCAEVVDAFAPPVIPIVSAPPTSGGSGGSADPGQPPAAGDMIPQAGSWTVSYNPIGSVSCLDVPPQNFPVDAASFRLSLSVRDGGATLILGGDTYTRTQTNTYVGFFDAPGFGSVRQVLRVLSPTQMSGEFTLNMSENGRSCSGTIYSTATHN